MMKKRYLKINAELVWATDKITSHDLTMNETIIDLQNWTVFNREENRWDDLPGDD